jgi:restriction system protein
MLLALGFIVIGLGVFGVTLAIVGSVLAYYSPSYREWLSKQPGYIKRLSKLPGFGSLAPNTLAVASAAYLVPLSLIGWVSISNAASTQRSFVTTVITGLIGLWLLYGLFIKGWGSNSSPNANPTLPIATNSYYGHLRQLDEIKALDPISFERFVGSLFERMGYKVKPTAVTADEGVDLFLQKDNRTAIVQCKRYEGTVGSPVVRDLYGAMIHNRADEAFLITTGTISLPAQQWASGKPVHLVDGTTLIEWVNTFKETSSVQPQNKTVNETPAGTISFPFRASTDSIKGSKIAASFFGLALIFPFLCVGSAMIAAPSQEAAGVTRSTTTSRSATPTISAATQTSQGAEAIPAPRSTETPIPTRPPRPTETTVPTETPVPTIAAATINQDVVVNDMRWKVLEVATSQPESSPNVKFVEVHFELEYLGSKAWTVYDFVNLYDQQDRKYEEQVFIGKDRRPDTCPFGLKEHVEPRKTRDCWRYFEVPKDAQNFRLEVTDTGILNEEKRYIDLGF